MSGEEGDEHGLRHNGGAEGLVEGTREAIDEQLKMPSQPTARSLLCGEALRRAVPVFCKFFHQQFQLFTGDRLFDGSSACVALIKMGRAVRSHKSEWNVPGREKIGRRIDPLAMAERDVEDRCVNVGCRDQPEDLGEAAHRPQAGMAATPDRVFDIGG